MAQPALDLNNLHVQLQDALDRAEAAELRAAAAERRALRAETHVALAEARARRLMEVGRRYRALVAHLPDTTLVVYDSDLRYQVVEGKGMAGGSPASMEGRTLGELFEPRVVEALESLYRRTLDGGDWERELEHDGQTYLVQGRPLRDENGRITAGMVLSRDITRLKQTEAALRREQEALRETIAEREVLLREVYHRVKNNLQVVSSLLSLQSRTISDPAAKQALGACRQRVAAMARVHEQLYRSPDVARIDLGAYLRELAGEVERTYRVGGAVEVVLEVQTVEADLQQAIPVGLIAHELIANAFQHAFTGRDQGRITVALRAGVDGAFDLEIGDDGVGMAESQERTLGTRLVRSLASQLDAELGLDTGPGDGTCWTVQIPRDPSLTARILIVEDEALIAADLADALEFQGYNIVGVVGSGDAAIAAVREHRPDLMLLDVNLRGQQDGIEVAQALRGEGPPVVFLTAHGDDGTLARAESVEPAGYLLKPFEERTLYATVRMALYRATAEREREERRALLASAVDRIDRAVLGMGPNHEIQLVNAPAAQAGVKVGASLLQALTALERADLLGAIRTALSDDDAPQHGFEVVRTASSSIVMLGTAAEAPLCLCAWCHKARSDGGGWLEVESVLRERYQLELTHGICQTCVETHFADFMEEP